MSAEVSAWLFASKSLNEELKFSGIRKAGGKPAEYLDEPTVTLSADRTATLYGGKFALPGDKKETSTTEEPTCWQYEIPLNLARKFTLAKGMHLQIDNF